MLLTSDGKRTCSKSSMSLICVTILSPGLLDSPGSHTFSFIFVCLLFYSFVCLLFFGLAFFFFSVTNKGVFFYIYRGRKTNCRPFFLLFSFFFWTESLFPNTCIRTSLFSYLTESYTWANLHFMLIVPVLLIFLELSQRIGSCDVLWNLSCRKQNRFWIKLSLIFTFLPLFSDTKTVTF